MRPLCASCLIGRAMKEIKRATDDPEIQMKAIKAVIKLMAELFDENQIPAFLGTERDRLIKRITGNPDPYREVKKFSNQKALEVLPILEEELSGMDEEEAFSAACRYAVGANRLDFDIPMHEPRPENLLEELRNLRLSIDHSQELREIVRGKDVLFLTDNAGEIVIDKLVIERLSELADRLTIATRGGPILNDATIEDAKMAGLHRYGELITTGTDAVGILLDQCSSDFLEAFERCEVVVAKGMANYESLSEVPLRKPIAYLMFVKCEPIGEDVGAPKDTGVILVKK